MMWVFKDEGVVQLHKGGDVSSATSIRSRKLKRFSNAWQNRSMFVV